ncbi:MAG: toll/interleukin-1 receptor domain-containing protein [Microscillaceae bacterium]|nr:toll/interleukin-1 receptor domain-containing protein [Microscillaceae bacterium]
MPSVSESTQKDVFISYSTKDQEAKTYIKNIFDREGITYFLDEVSLELGADIQHRLEAGLQDTHFTVLLVTRNSLFSPWVSLESIQRLKQEEFHKKVSFLPVLFDQEIFKPEFPIEMLEHFKKKKTEYEALRTKAVTAGLDTKMYNDEIERIEEIIPQVDDIVQKIKNSLSANFADEKRKIEDEKKLIKTILAARTLESPNPQKEMPLASNQETLNTSKPINRLPLLRWGIGIAVGLLVFFLILSFFSGLSSNQIPAQAEQETATQESTANTQESEESSEEENAVASLISQEGPYLIKNKVVEDSTVLTLFSGNDAEESSLYFGENNQDNYQKFYLKKDEEGNIYIINEDEFAIAPQHLDEASTDTGDKAYFNIIEASEGYFLIASVSDTEYVLSVSEEGEIILSAREENPTDAQLFWFELIEENEE